ncbi:MAG: hypothetical protein R3B96_18760 [Pirellulaceae bacterium]
MKQAAQDQVRKLLNEPAGGGLPGDEPRPLDPESLRADALIVFGSAAEAAGWVDLQAEVETWPTEQGTLHKSQMGAVSCLAWINRNSPPTFLEDLIAWARPRLVVLAGFAVGLDPDARRGSLVIGQQVAKSGSDELTSPLGFDDSSGAGQGLVMGKLITVNAPPEPGEPRQRLATEHSALAADPDAYAYAEIAERKGRPWIAIPGRLGSLGSYPRCPAQIAPRSGEFDREDWSSRGIADAKTEVGQRALANSGRRHQVE